MIRVERKVRIEWRNNPSSFEIKNKDIFKTDFLRLGSAIRPVNELLSRGEELRVLLPSVIGVSPIDPSWQEQVTTYLHDFLLEIPRYGLVFDISYTFDMGDPAYRENIDRLKSTIENLPKDSKECEKVLLDKIKKLNEDELYQYVKFYNVEDYIKWRYCLLSSKVANSVEDINKSVNIQFYLTSDTERKAIKAKQAKVRTQAITVYTKLVNGEDKSKIDSIIVASGKLTGYTEFKELTDDDKSMILLELCDENPQEFLNLCDDKNITLKAKINIYLWMNLIKKLPGSEIIVDSSHPEIIIGNNISEAISYFANELNKAYVSEIEAKYRSLKR